VDKKRKIIAAILLLIIISGMVYIFINKDSLFENRVTIYYKDGCVEKWVNKKLTTPKCNETIIEEPAWRFPINPRS